MRILFLLLFFNNIEIYGQSGNVDKELVYCEVFFTSGFEGKSVGDSLNLTLNGKTIYENLYLYSVKSYGYTNETFKVFKLSNKAFVYIPHSNPEETTTYLGSIKKRIQIKIAYHGSVYVFDINVKNGKYILFNDSTDGLKMVQLLRAPEFS